MFIAICAYIKEKRKKSNNLKERKKEQAKPKVRQKEKIIIFAEIFKKEIRKTTKKINEMIFLKR